MSKLPGAVLMGLVMWCGVGLGVSGAPPAVEEDLVVDQLGDDLSCGGFCFSLALSADGNWLAIGEERGGQQQDVGSVRVFEWSGELWGRVGDDLVGSSARFGSSVALSADGTRLAVGEPGGSGELGRIRVFDWDGSSWLQVGTDVANEVERDFTGGSLALSADGTRLAASTNLEGLEQEDRTVRVFDWDGAAWNDTWHFESTFGRATSHALSSDGRRLAIQFEQWAFPFATTVRWLDWDGTTWTTTGPEELLSDGPFSDMTLSADGLRLVAGRSGIDVSPGRVFAYDLDGAAWAERWSSAGDMAGDDFGSSVVIAADGTRVVVGADQDVTDPLGQYPGYVRVIDWEPADSSKVRLTLAGDSPGDGFGAGVAMSADGRRLAVYAYGYASDSQYIRAYELTDAAATTTTTTTTTVPADTTPTTPTTTMPLPETLPATGTELGALLIAAGLLLVGVGLTVTARRANG